MRDVISSSLVLAVWFVPFFALYGITVLARWWYHRRGRRNPISDNLLRGPGHTLAQQRESDLVHLIAHLTIGSVVPLIAYAVYLSQAPESRNFWVLFIVAVAGVCYAGYRMVQAVHRLRDNGLGFEAESAVGQELNWLMREGFAVFHDVPGDKNFNIDHVVVGAQGVFAVETKGRSKPVGGRGVEYKVEHVDGALVFPNWRETEPLEQARRNAQWLGKWLTAAVGEPVTAKPVLAIPGWWVERKSPSDVAILSGKNARGYFTKARVGELSEKLVRQIVHQLDQRCRDVETRTYKPAKED